MKKASIQASLVAMLAGCAVQPIPLRDSAIESHRVPIQKLVVDNLSTEAKIGVGDVVYVNGWAPAHAGFIPPLNEAFVAKIKNSLIASGSAGRADITVLRVGFFYEKTVADDIVFVGMLAAGRERGIKCDADVNVKTERESKRTILSHEIRRPHFDNQEQIRTFIETCQSELIRQLAREITSAL